METQVGIDVGGTFTDAVLFKGKQIIDYTKVPTQADCLVDTLLNALENLGVFHQSVQQITVSTTLVTNAILQNKLLPVELFLFPGSGMKLESLSWPIPYHILTGEIDYRGREVSPPDELEWRRLLNTLDFSASPHVAIVSKFSHRNKVFEEGLADFLLKHFPHLEIACGHEWGQANFYRRSLTTYLNLGCSPIFSDFSSQLKEVLRTKGCQARISVLKADGGVLPLNQLRPVESIYSGPAASILGALAQSRPDESFVVIDIGGTTTDIGLVLSGEPLLSSEGAEIGAFSTQVRTLAVRSIPVGGDSVILTYPEGSDGFTLAPYRTGPAYCQGGNAPTPTDAMRYLNLTSYGDFSLAEQGLTTLLPPESRTPEALQNLAQRILEKVSEEIGKAVEGLYKEWREEPAYKVWEVLHPHSQYNFHIWASGGGAQGLSSFLERRLGASVYSGKYAAISNAIGAALARPTFSCTLNLDTSIRRYRIEESGEQGDWFGALRPYKEVEEFLKRLAARRLEKMGIDGIEPKLEPFDYFPVVRGYETVGQIIRGALVVPPGVVGRVEE